MRLLSAIVAAAAFASAANAAVPQWVRAAIPSSMPAIAADAKAVVLLDEQTVTVSADGEMTTREVRVTKILTNAGRDVATAALWLDRNTKAVLLQGWTIDRSGREYEVRDRDAIEQTPYGELYTDTRVKVLRLPNAEPGSIVAYEIVHRDRPPMPQLVWRVQGDIPVVRALLHVDRSSTASWQGDEQIRPVWNAEEAFWEMRDVPAIADEPRMPDRTALAGRLGVAFRKTSWSDIARWFGGLAASRAVASPPIAEQVRALTRAEAGQSIREIARFVQRDVRYVAVEIGIGGYQPHAAADVFRNRFGDCKDKATLLQTMLRAAGVASYHVVVHTTRGMVDPEFASIASFNHVILAIAAPERTHATITHPKLGPLIVFDPTSTTTAFGELPPWLQGSRGLLVTPDGGELVELPVAPPEANQLRRTAKLTLDANGTLHGAVVEVRTGSIASSMRYALQQRHEAERVQYVDAALARHLAHSRASNVAIENLEDANAELVVRYELEAPQYAKQVADMLLVRPRVLGEKAETLVATQDRRYDYETDGPSLQTDDIEIALAPPLRLDELPSPVTVATPMLDYTSASSFANGVLRYRRTSTLRALVVPKKDLAALNVAFSKIMADERASAVIR